MSKTTESGFYGHVRSGLGKVGHVSRVESSAASGMPDVSFAARGREAWLELKVEKPGCKLYFELSQPLWMRERVRVGVTPWILWLSYDESWVYLAKAQTLLLAEKEYKREQVVVKSEYLKDHAWKRRLVPWREIADVILGDKVP